MKKEKLVFICAHPDDEAFGPGGTLALYAKTQEVYVLCVTRGEAGQKKFIHPSEHISTVREKELYESAKILGIKKVIFLDFIDGELCNNLYHHLAGIIQSHLDKIRPQTVMTFETRGVSGHIDHIAVSYVVTYLFERLSYIKKLMYYCMAKEFTDLQKDYFIYYPPGLPAQQADEIVDISAVWKIKKQAMNKHASQKNDYEHVIPILERIKKLEYFVVKNK